MHCGSRAWDFSAWIGSLSVRVKCVHVQPIKNGYARVTLGDLSVCITMPFPWDIGLLQDSRRKMMALSAWEVSIPTSVLYDQLTLYGLGGAR